jgi:hypothetical protein
MKPILLSAFALTTALAATTSFAESRELQSVRESSELMALFDDLKEFASSGASLEFFGWEENFPTGSKEDCREVAAPAVVNEFREMTREIFVDGATVSERAMSDFAQVIGDGRYSRCYQYRCANRSCSRTTSFYSLNSDYRIQFELAYED